MLAIDGTMPMNSDGKDYDMRDFRDAKVMAQTIRAVLSAQGVQITVSESLEMIAKAFGLADWNTLSAKIKADAGASQRSTVMAPPDRR